MDENENISENLTKDMNAVPLIIKYRRDENGKEYKKRAILYAEYCFGSYNVTVGTRK